MYTLDIEQPRAAIKPTLPAQAAPRVVMTTCGATSDDKAGPMTTPDLFEEKF